MGISLVLVGVVVGVLITSFYFSYSKSKPPQNPEALWPTEGEVIATIDGKEYCYDPIYLYRLTNTCFSDDYNASVDDIIGAPATWSDFGVIYGETQGDAAICLELLYKEGLQVDGAVHIEGYLEEIKYERHDKVEPTKYLNSEQLAKLNARHKESKFSKSQSDEKFLSQLHPYIKKYAYIDNLQARDYMAMSGLDKAQYYAIDQPLPTTTEEREAHNEIYKQVIYENLKKKYNVEMVMGE